jgi:N-succinyldiaminopimelate aminotransferase
MYNQRLDVLGDGPFRRLAALLDGITPAGDRKSMLMSLGEPRHPFPGFVGEVLHANRQLYDRYPPPNGTAAFRAAVAAWLGERYGVPEGMVDPERHIVALAGTREGLFMLAPLVVPETKAMRRPLVLMPNPFYHCYAGAAVAAGAEPVYLPATRETGFLPDFTRLSEETLAATALVYLCSPANPQGAVASVDYFADLFARAYDFVVAVDECYAEIYDRDPPPGALEACAHDGDMGNVVAFHSLSKRSSVPGLRSGFAVGDAELMARFRELRAYGSATTPRPVCEAATALWGDSGHVEANRALYREKFDIAERILHGRLDFYRPPGGFFLWLDVGDGTAAARKLWREAAISVLPGSYLGREVAGGVNPGAAYIRIALVADNDEITAALTDIERILQGGNPA